MSFLFAFLSTAISILLIQLSIYTFQIGKKFETEIKKNFSVNIFLAEGSQQEGINQIKEQINSHPFVEEAKFINKDEAARKFLMETGEEFKEVLSYNPLPASFVVTLKFSSSEINSIDKVLKEFEAIKGVDDVVFEADSFRKALSFIDSVQEYMIFIISFFSFISFYIVFSTLRLILQNQEEEITTMKLVGASTAMISAPIILSGVIIGLLSGTITTIVFVIALSLFSDMIRVNVDVLYLPGKLFPFIGLIVGPIIGFICSTFVTRNIKLQSRKFE